MRVDTLIYGYAEAMHFKGTRKRRQLGFNMRKGITRPYVGAPGGRRAVPTILWIVHIPCVKDVSVTPAPIEGHRLTPDKLAFALFAEHAPGPFGTEVVHNAVLAECTSVSWDCMGDSVVFLRIL